jgi:hypothetical protein
MARLEQTIPFPVNVEEFYASLFPPEFMAVAMSHKVDVPLRNMRAVTPRSSTATVMLAPDKFVRCAFSKPFPVPQDSLSTASSELIACNRDHPALSGILEWYEKATMYDVRLAEAETVMVEVLGSTASPAWQELHKAIGTPPRRCTLRAQRRLSELMTESQKRQFGDMLAAALLLPETKLPHAWVGLLGR